MEKIMKVIDICTEDGDLESQRIMWHAAKMVQTAEQKSAILHAVILTVSKREDGFYRTVCDVRNYFAFASHMMSQNLLIEGEDGEPRVPPVPKHHEVPVLRVDETDEDGDKGGYYLMNRDAFFAPLANPCP